MSTPSFMEMLGDGAKSILMRTAPTPYDGGHEVAEITSGYLWALITILESRFGLEEKALMGICYNSIPRMREVYLSPTTLVEAINACHDRHLTLERLEMLPLTKLTSETTVDDLLEAVGGNIAPIYYNGLDVLKKCKGYKERADNVEFLLTQRGENFVGYRNIHNLTMRALLEGAVPLSKQVLVNPYVQEMYITLGWLEKPAKFKLSDEVYEKATLLIDDLIYKHRMQIASVTRSDMVTFLRYDDGVKKEVEINISETEVEYAVYHDGEFKSGADKFANKHSTPV